MNRVSIVTICFNNVEELKLTCTSVDMQVLKPYEHIVIDGSTKPAIKLFLENNPQPAYRKWICESDKGIADAFNKGIRNVTGDIILLLNSGDKIYDETVLERVTAIFKKDPSIMWCHGKQSLLRGGIWVLIGKPFEKAKLYRGMRGTFHQTMYVRKELYEKYGLYDNEIKMAMDYDFLCRIAGERFTFIDYPLATFDPTGISTNRYLDAMNEAYAQYRKYYGWSLKQKLWSLRLTTLHFMLKNPFGKLLYRLKVKLGKENM